MIFTFPLILRCIYFRKNTNVTNMALKSGQVLDMTIRKDCFLNFVRHLRK